MTLIGLAYLVTALAVGCWATYANRQLFVHATKRHLRMVAHTIVIGLFWPLLAVAAIAALRKPIEIPTIEPAATDEVRHTCAENGTD